MHTSRLDRVYRKMVVSKFFTKGWGDPDHLMKLVEFRKKVSNRSECYRLVAHNHPIKITEIYRNKDFQISEGKFTSPFALHLPEIIPEEVQEARFQMILPSEWGSETYKPICIHLAGTGDHHYWRRREIMARPLLEHKIGSIILENPFYGHRKPKGQTRSSLHNVSDIFVMGGCLILECLALLNWCENSGYGPLGLSGISMGGHMASLAATNWPKPVVLVPCLSWTTASVVFTEGVMSQSIDWKFLQEQYLNNKYYEKLANLVRIIDEDFLTDISPTKSQLFLAKYWPKSRLLSPVVPKLFPRYYNTTLTRFKKPKDAVRFMCGIMDECTHLRNFSIPYDTSLITVICAQRDGYVPRKGCATIEEIWPGATVKYLRGGHISAFFRHNNSFRKYIVDAFEKAGQK